MALLQFIILTQFFRDLDAIIARRGSNYMVHALYGLVIVGLTAPDVVAAFSMQAGSINWNAVTLCYALHAYNIVNYARSFKDDDWLYYGLMVGVPLGTIINCGSLVGCNLFFTTGLPGVISYGLLFAEHNNLILSSTIKQWNARTNLWIRAPGCLATATLLVVKEPQITSILIAVLTASNGLYFMERAIKARYVNTLVAN